MLSLLNAERALLKDSPRGSLTSFVGVLRCKKGRGNYREQPNWQEESHKKLVILPDGARFRENGSISRVPVVTMVG